MSQKNLYLHSTFDRILSNDQISGDALCCQMSEKRTTQLMESAVRKKVDRLLDNLHWVTDEENPVCNVTTEVPKTVEQKKKLNGREGDYFLYKTGTDEIIAILETKRPDESIRDALDQAIEFYAKPLGVNIVFATDGTITEAFHVKDNTDLKKDGEVITDLLTESELLQLAKNVELLVRECDWDESAQIFSEDVVIKIVNENEEFTGIMNSATPCNVLKEGISEFP